MTIVITGASGFVGRHVQASALARGRDVIALTRDARRLESKPRLRVIETDYASIAGYLPRSSIVVHLAAVRSTPGARHLVRVNVEVTQRIARAAVESGVARFIHLGTALVLGQSSTPLDETAPLAESKDPYLASKIAGIRALEAIEGLPLVTLLPSIVYGPDHPLAPNRVTSHMRRILRASFRIGVGGPSAPRNLVFIDDVLRAIERAEDEPIGTRRVVAGEDVTQDAFEREVYAAAGRAPAPRIVVPRALVRVAARAADVFTRGEAGWSHRIDMLQQSWCFRPSFPYTPLVEGIRRTVGSL